MLKKAHWISFAVAAQAVLLFILFAGAALAQQQPVAPTPAPPAQPTATPVPASPVPATPAPTPPPTPQPTATPAPTPTPPGRPQVTPTPGPPGQQTPPPAPTPAPTPRKTPRPPQGQRVETAVPPIKSPIKKQVNAPTDADAEPLPVVPADLPKATVLVTQQAIEKVTEAINKQTGATVKAMEQVQGQKVDLKAKDETVEQILNELVVGKDWTWIQREDGTYEIWDKPSFVDKELKKRVIRRIIPVRYVNAADIQPAIDGLKSEVGQLAINPRTNEIIVTDVPDKVALIESVVKELDVQLYTQTFYVRYAGFDDIQARIDELKSPAGLIQIDPANRKIIVTDTFQKLKQMQQLIEQLDVERPMMKYNLSSIGKEGKDAKDVIDNIIKPMVTQDALLQFNESQSILLVQDIPEVHDRILEVLRSIDSSPKQVWIEGEILDVNDTFKVNFGTELVYDRDLASAFKASNIALPRISAGSGGLNVLTFAGNVQATLTALMSDSDTRLLLQPRVLVRNNEQEIIELTQQNPQLTTFFNSFNGGGFNNGGQSSSITFVPTGVSLSLTPTISNRGLIEMTVDFENSSPLFVELKTGTGNTQSAVGVNSQHLTTVLTIPSGETRVLGGLITRQDDKTTAGVPYLSRIPILGWLFGNKSKSNSKRNLLFFLTPTIVEEKPQIDMVQVPVNEAARQLQEHGIAAAAGPANLNPLPNELRQYLKSSKPANLPPIDENLLPETTEPTTNTLNLPRELPSLETLDGRLIDEAYRKPESEDLGGGIRGPGASLLSERSKVSGPSGVINVPTSGGGKTGGKKAPGRAGARPAPTPTAGTRPTTPTTPAGRRPPTRPGTNPAAPGQGVTQSPLGLPPAPGVTESRR